MIQLAHTSDAPSRRHDLAVRSVDRWVGRILAGPAGDDFLRRRAEFELRELPDGIERRLLDLVLRAATSASGTTASTRALLAWAGHLEGRGLYPWAGDVVDRALRLHPGHAEITLHAARIRRKAGETDRARELYDRVLAAPDPSGRLPRMARIGHALLEASPEARLGREIRRALGEGDPEAAAVAQEARARVRATQGKLRGSLRDYLMAAIRYDHPVDLGRIGHDAADLLLRHGEIAAARRVLLEVEAKGHPGQVDRARARLRDLAVAQSDEVGARRWSDAPPTSLVSLSPGRRSGPEAKTIDLDRVLARVERLAAPRPDA